MLLVSPAGALDDGLERRDRLGEQLRPGDAAGRAAAEQVRLHRREAVVAALYRVGEHFLAEWGGGAVPVAVLGRVVAEDANVRRAEDLAQLDGPLEALQVRLERLVDANLADRRADGAEPEAVLVEQRLEFPHLEVGQVEDVRLEDRPQLDVLDAAASEDVDLLLRVG